MQTHNHIVNYFYQFQRLQSRINLSNKFHINAEINHGDISPGVVHIEEELVGVYDMNAPNVQAMRHGMPDIRVSEECVYDSDVVTVKLAMIQKQVIRENNPLAF